jgi:hypothetical protein
MSRMASVMADPLVYQHVHTRRPRDQLDGFAVPLLTPLPRRPRPVLVEHEVHRHPQAEVHLGGQSNAFKSGHRHADVAMAACQARLGMQVSRDARSTCRRTHPGLQDPVRHTHFRVWAAVRPALIPLLLAHKE